MRMLEKLAVIHTECFESPNFTQLAQKFYEFHSIGDTIILDCTNTLTYISRNALSPELMCERLITAMQRGEYVLIATRAGINVLGHVHATRLQIVSIRPSRIRMSDALIMHSAGASICSDDAATASLLDRTFDTMRIDYDDLVEI